MRKNELCYTISGLDCADCALHLENKIKSISGIREAKVNVVNATLNVVYETDYSNEEKVRIIAKKAGYKLDASKQDEKDLLFYYMLYSGLTVSAGFIFLYISPVNILANIFLITGILVGGYSVAVKGFKEIRSGQLGMNFLMSLAVMGALIIGEWLEAGMVVFLFVLAQFLERRSMVKARKSVQLLMDKRVDIARVKNKKKSEIRPIDHVKIGEIIIIKPGDQIPLDGRVQSGHAEINQASITGESTPVAKKGGDTVFAGSISLDGYLEVEVTRLSTESTISRIIQLIEKAQAQKAPKQAFIEKFARYYTPLVISVSILLALVPPFIFNYDFNEWLYRALVVLVIACPCALVISTPVAIISGLTAAMKQGILVKGGIFLEEFNQVDAIAFDKTGTVTTGEAVISKIYTLNEHTPHQLFSIAAALEKRSEHPLAKSILSYMEEQNSNEYKVSRFKVLKGKGIEGWLSGNYHFLGNRKLCEEKGLLTQNLLKLCSEIEDANHTIVFIGSDKKVIGIIALTDQIRPEVLELIPYLRKQGVRHSVLLTGDNRQTANSVCEVIGIDACYSELLPEEKVAVIRKLKQSYKKVTMIGDGLNDAPAMAASDIGIAMGRSGTDVTLETADVVFMKDDLSKIVTLKRISKKMLSVIQQNIFIALALKFIFLLLAIPGFATLWMAVFADMGASLIVIFNGLRVIQENK